jgi:hypothetical protein
MGERHELGYFCLFCGRKGRGAKKSVQRKFFRCPIGNISDTPIGKYSDTLVGNLSTELNEDGFSYRNLKLYRLFYQRYPQVGTYVPQFVDKQFGIGQSPIAYLYLPDMIKSPFTFEFLGLKAKDVVYESDLEQALIEHMEDFLLELGYGFCFEARQKRIIIGGEYYFCDLVFYHRILKCSILVEIKIGSFSHEHIGQLKTYVNYYRKEVMRPDDNPPIGILLVTNKNDALVEYAIAENDRDIFVSKYMLELPTKEQLVRYVYEEFSKITL